MMNSWNQKYALFKVLFMVLSLAFLLLHSSAGKAVNTPVLALAEAPLFLSTAVEPNIHFILDDSGSMKWEVMVSPDITEYESEGGKPRIDGFYRKYLTPDWYQDEDHDEVIPPISSFPGAWMAKNTEVNPIYYDPTNTYVPWPGNDINGNPLYSDADPENAMQRVYLGTSSKKTNLKITQTFHNNDSEETFDVYLPVYYNWIDTDGDGVIEVSDAYVEVEIRPGNEHLFLNGRSYAEEMQNFANWFQYYRARELSAKVAIGNVINGSSSTRMGLSLINNGQKNDVASMGDTSHKLSLLSNLYEITSGNSTPLRRALEASGKMFKGKKSPILSFSEGGSCQQNFQILMTDGYWNGNSPSSSIGNADSDNNTAFDGGNYAGAASKTLADVAMHYYETDLKPKLANEVPTIAGIDYNNQQHLVTYTIAFGLKGHLDYEVLDPDKGEVTWPNTVSSNTIATIDDLWHAAYNGRGEYLNAAYPELLSESLDKIIANIAERSATASAVAINSAKLTTDTVIYKAEFNTYRWQGEIYAFPIANLETGELAADADWEAGKKLTNRDITTNPRTIITYTGSQGVAFQWDDAISATHKNDLETTPTGATSSEAEAKARLNFIRGARDNEGAGLGFRTRSSLLGDVVNSGPVYVAAPDLNWPDFAPFPTSNGDFYSDFKEDQKDRPGVIYVGANDGMLHGFAEKDGEEILAYIPNILYSTEKKEGMHYLTDPNYVHKYYNDLTPSISDVYINQGQGKDWASILIGGLRHGGRGIYALDVTDPTAFSEANADKITLWEFSNNDDADLGYTYSKPQIALTDGGKWVAIFGNGYNDTGSGQASLFIVDIEAASVAKGVWSTDNYKKISTNSGSPDNPNGLGTPSLADLDGNGTVDRVYAGDLKGQLWVFDLRGSANSWSLVDANPLFTTIDNRPITAKPALSFHPTVGNSESNEPNVMVFFGSGQYLTEADITDTSLNHFYGVWDSGKSNFNLTSNSLQQQTYDTSFEGRVLTNDSVDYNNSSKGWFFTLPDLGERSVTKAVVRFDVIFFNTFVPNGSACAGGGYGFKMAVDSATGGALGSPVFDTNGDGVVDDLDYTSNGNSTSTISGLEQDGYLPEPVFIENLSFTADTAIKVSNQPERQSGRLSWQELLK